MFDFLDKVRAMPNRTKRRLAGICSVIVTTVLFVVWLGFGPLGPSGGSVVSAEKKETPSPLSVVFETASSVWGKMVGQVSEIGEQFDSLEDKIINLASSTIASTSPSTNLVKPKDKVGSIIIRDSFATSSFKATLTDQ